MKNNRFERGDVFMNKLSNRECWFVDYHYDENEIIVLYKSDYQEIHFLSELEYIGFDKNIVQLDDACVSDWYHPLFTDCYFDIERSYKLLQIDKEDSQKIHFKLQFGDDDNEMWLPIICFNEFPNIEFVSNNVSIDSNGSISYQQNNVCAEITLPCNIELSDEDDEEISIELPKMQQSIF